MSGLYRNLPELKDLWPGNDFYYDPGLGLVGVPRLNAWGRHKEGRLRRWSEGIQVADLGPKKAAPIHALVDALTARARV